ncbi:hypothetical protein C8R43DRAFT_962908 [Mycena crocata]|nr:hypothetical protein C8R43DRAFT_962908 [Mycena crocata]
MAVIIVPLGRLTEDEWNSHGDVIVGFNFERLQSSRTSSIIQLLPDLKRRDWWCGSTQDVGLAGTYWFNFGASQTVSTTDWFIVNVATHKLRYNIRYPQHQPAFAILDGAFRIEPRVSTGSESLFPFEPYRRPRIHTDKPRAFRRSVDSATQKYSTAALSMPVGIISGMLVPGCKLTLLLQIGLNCHRLITPADFEILHNAVNASFRLELKALRLLTSAGADFLTAGIILTCANFVTPPLFKTSRVTSLVSWMLGVCAERPSLSSNRLWTADWTRYSVTFKGWEYLQLYAGLRSDPLLFKHREYVYIDCGVGLWLNYVCSPGLGLDFARAVFLQNRVRFSRLGLCFTSPRLWLIRPISVRVQGRQRVTRSSLPLRGLQQPYANAAFANLKLSISNIFVPAMATDPEATPPPAIRLDGP